MFSETDQFPLSVGRNVRVTFDDGNAYIGLVKSASPDLSISFLHSGNTYTFDADSVAHGPGHPYDNRKALEMKVYGEGKNPFSGTSETAISFLLKDDQTHSLRGEIDVKLTRTDTGDVVYSDTLSAETATANSMISLGLKDNQHLNMFVDFHPAMMPYTSNPDSSSVIDRTTTISGSGTFTYRNISNLHFEVLLVNEISEVTATSAEQAIRTKYSEVQTNSSHTTGTSSSNTGTTGSEASFSGEAGISLFGTVKAGGSVNGSNSETNGSSETTTTGGGTNDGSGESIGSTVTAAKKFNVYSPKGLKISPQF